MKKLRGRKRLAILLVLCMALASVPVTVLAEWENPAPVHADAAAPEESAEAGRDTAEADELLRTEDGVPQAEENIAPVSVRETDEVAQSEEVFSEVQAIGEELSGVDEASMAAVSDEYTDDDDELNPPVDGEGSGIPGDADDDGAVDENDRTALSQYLAGWDDVAIQTAVCDLNGDGVVNGKDRAILARFLAGWEGYDIYLEYEPDEGGGDGGNTGGGSGGNTGGSGVIELPIVPVRG